MFRRFAEPELFISSQDDGDRKVGPVDASGSWESGSSARPIAALSAQDDHVKADDGMGEVDGEEEDEEDEDDVHVAARPRFGHGESEV